MVEEYRSAIENVFRQIDTLSTDVPVSESDIVDGLIQAELPFAAVLVAVRMRTICAPDDTGLVERALRAVII